MFQVNNKDTITTPMVSFWCRSGVFIINFEKANTEWMIDDVVDL